MRMSNFLAVILALLGVAAIGSLVPLLDAFNYALDKGGTLLVLSFLVLLLGMGVWLIIVAWRMYRRK